ncbi:MAG: sensor histidine kinase, partial [Chloroflexota bacterium]
VVEDVVGRFRIVSPGHQIRLVWDGDRFSGSWDLDRLEQVLNNLLSNAIKYSPEGREVTVVVARQEESVRISVRDEGVGISAEDQEKLFQRFYRAGGEGHQVKGLGLGLYVTRRIIEAHGGTIAVHSETGRGSEFVITLPVEAIAEPSRA